MKLSALVVAHNEEKRLPACLDHLRFADELVVVVDKSTDRTKEIAQSYGAVIVEGAWDLEGDRRNQGIAACSGDWILEVDADEHVTPQLAQEIRKTIDISPHGWHLLRFDNFIGQRRVRHGWGGSFGTSAVPRLFRKGAKVWGQERVHPSLTWTGSKGPILDGYVNHYVDRDLSDMIHRLNSYSSAKARDLRDRGETWGSTASNVRRMVTRFFKCYVRRQGWREGGYGFMVALCASLYPILSHMKAKLDQDDSAATKQPDTPKTGP